MTGVMLVVALAVYFRPELHGAFVLEAWARGKPAELLEEFNTAVRSGDLAAAQALSPGAQFEVEDGIIATMKPPATRGGPGPFEVASVLPPLGARPEAVKYMMGYAQVQVVVRAEDGGPAVIAFSKPKGRWEVVWFAPGESVRD